VSDTAPEKWVSVLLHTGTVLNPAYVEWLESEAARYRWLRDSPDANVELLDYNEDGSTDTWYQHLGEDLDAAIDAAMGKP
jgi:hypothetical protein